MKLKIHIDDSVTPVAQHARRIPIALRQKVEDRLEQLLNMGIIEEVNVPSQWVSPLAINVKDNGDVRLCVDMRQANVAIDRVYHVMPTVDDFISK